MSESHRWERLSAAALPAPGEIVDLVLPDSVTNEEDWVLWRTESGVLCASAARCPHLWSHFAAEGEVRGESLACLSHGWQFGCDGAGTDRWGEPASPVTVLACRETDYGGVEVQFPVE